MWRPVEYVWRALAWWPVMLLWVIVLLACGFIAWRVPQQPLGAPVSTDDLRSLLPGLFSMKDVLHSAPFLVASLGLGVGVALTAADRLLSDRRPDVGTLFEGVFFAGLLAVLVIGLVQLYTFRQVEIPLGPGESALVPSMDLTVRANVTGWKPETGAFATIETVSRLAGGDLAGPFGNQDRPADARLAADSVDVLVKPGTQTEVDNVRLTTRVSPPEWAARVMVSYQTRSETSPYLRSGQSWIAVTLMADPVLTVGVPRVLPSFDPSISIIMQPLGGPATKPAAVVALAQENDQVGSRALAPGEKVVMGDFVVLLDGYAPVVSLVVSTRSFAPWILVAFGVMVIGGLGLLGFRLIVRRRRTTAIAAEAHARSVEVLP
jgi:hypothetical protein